MKALVRIPLTFLAVALGVAPLTSAFATSRNWNGGGTDNFWTTGANWGGTAPAASGDSLLFYGSNRQNNTNNYASLSVVNATSPARAIYFDTGGWILNGNPVSLGGGIGSLTGTNAINHDLVLTGTRTVYVTAGELTINGVISGAQNLVKSDAGTLVLTASNTYSGTTTISTTAGNSGIVRITNPRALGTGPVGINRQGSTTSGYLQLDIPGVNTISNTFNGFNSANYGEGAVPQIENLSGTNTIVSGLTVTLTGGNGLVVRATGGLLVLAGPLGTTQSSRSVNLNGPGNGLVTGSLTNLSISFPVRKEGAGTWTLNGTNFNGGATYIYNGKFVLGASGAMSNSTPVDIAAGATFDVSAQAGGWTLNAGKQIRGAGTILGTVNAAASATLVPGTAATPTTTAGTLTFGNSLALNGVNLAYNLSSDPTGLVRPSDQIVVNGDLNVTGVNTFTLGSYLNGYIPNGTYKLIKFNGTLSGDASNFAVTGFAVGARGEQGGYIVTNVGSIDLVVTGTPPASLVWQGDGIANLWDIQTSSNWLNGAALDQYYNYDTVLFDDSATNREVTIAAPVTPGNVTINATNDYVITDISAAISGIAGLTKLGPGTLTISNTVNNYTGVTTYGGGKVRVLSVGNSSNGGGTGSSIGAATKDFTTQVLNGGTLEYIGLGESSDRLFSVGPNGGGISVAEPTATLAFTNTGPISSDGYTFTKSGPGTLQYNYQGLLTGTNFILGGVLRIPTVNLFGTERTIPVYIDGGALNLNGQSMENKPVVVKGMGDLTLGTTNGAIINLGASQINALRLVTLTGDTAFGGTGNWHIRGNPTASLSTGGNDYDLIKVGLNQISVVDAIVDAALGDIEVREGVFGYELGTTGLGNPARTLTVRANASFLLYGSTVPLNKQIVFEDYATNTVPNGLSNTIAGPVNLVGQFGWGPIFTVANNAMLTIAGPISGTGQLIKQGAGTLTLAGTNTYTGMTTISAGKLVLSSVHAGGGDITVDDSTASPTFGVTAVGSSQAKPNSLMLGYGINPVACEFNNLASTTTAPLRATNLTVNSTVTVNINSGAFLTGQTYPLIAFDTLGGAGSFVLGTLPPLVSGNLVTNGNTLALSVTSAVAIETWTGAVNGNWDIGSTANWLFNSAPAVFANGNAARFDDTGSNTAVTVTAPVSPSGMIVNNASKTYSFTGSSIGGSGSLLKQGAGELNLSSANTYSGGTTLSAGTLNLNANSAPGTGPLTIEGGTLNNIGGSPVTLTANNPQNWNGSFTFGGTQDLDLGAGAVTLGTNITLNAAGSTLTVGGAISDGGAGFNFTKNGPGTLTLGAANNYGGNTTINAGTVKATATGALPATTAVGFTAATSATLDLSATSQSVSNLVFANPATATITIAGTNNSSLNVSPASLTFAPSTTAFNLAVNMAALETFTYNNSTGTFEVRNGISSAASSGQTSVVTLAGQTNTIVATNLNVGTISSTSGLLSSTLNLGMVNTISASTITLGNGRAGGRIQFAAGLTNPVLTLAVTTLRLGNHDSFNNSDTPVDWIDTTGGLLNAQLGDVVLARISPPGTMTANRAVRPTSTLRMGAGSLTASSLTLGLINDASSGSFNYNISNRAELSLVGAGTATVTNLTLANSLYTGNFSATSALIATVGLTNGATLRATSIAQGSIATPSGGNLAVTTRVEWGDGTLGNIAGADLTITNVDVVLLGDTTTHAFDITSGQNGTIHSVVSGNGALTKSGAGLLTLAAANTYTGGTFVNGGTLALANTATLVSTNLVVAGGATLDVTALGGALALTGQSLGNSSSTALLNGSVDATLGQLGLTYAAGTPALSVANGTLTLDAATPVTVNNTGAALGNGSYKLIAAGAGGSVAGTAPAAVSVTGNGLGSGGAATLAITGSELFLNVTGVSAVNPNPTNLTAVVSGTNLNLSWPASHTGWTLQVQTNSRSVGLNTNWFDVPGSAATNAVSIPVNPANPTVFFRMRYTNP